MDEYNCTKVRLRDKKNGRECDALFDKSRQLLFFDYMTVEFALHMGFEFIEESEERSDKRTSNRVD